MATTKKRRVAVLIDGSNFYFKIRTLTKQKTDFIHFQYKKFIQDLAGKDATVVFAGYYVGVVRAKPKDAKGELLRRSQQNLFNQLRLQGVAVITGFLMEHDGHYYEKGVDVRMAVDIATGAYEKQFDEVVLVSSDTDLLPAVRKAQSRGRKVHYVGFSHKPSLAMVRVCNTSRLLLPEDIHKYDRGPVKLKIRRFDEDAGEE